MEKVAVLVASGSYLPRGLTFGPTNGPEDFQELVFIVFTRRLYREWFLFLDDLSVATGRPSPLPEGPSGAHDVVTKLVERAEKLLAAKGLGRAASSDPSPYAHVRVVVARIEVKTIEMLAAKGLRRVASSLRLAPMYVCVCVREGRDHLYSPAHT